MRVITRLQSGRARDDRGVVAVVVAICAVVLFAATAYAIDTGHSWAQRRHLVTATDAAALASVEEYARGGTGCDAVAADYLGRNAAEALMDSCTFTSTGGNAGYVSVTAHQQVDHAFARIFGVSSTTVHSTTSARFGTPSALSGLRPLGLCVDANEQLKDWLDLPGGPGDAPETITITYSKATPDACGDDAPGNWGVLDFDGGANSNNDTKAWVEDGYPGEVSIGDQVPGDTGAFSTSLDRALMSLQDSGEVFGLPVYDAVSGNGSNAEFHVAAFVAVQLVGFKSNGPESARYLTLRFQRAVLQGSCCGDGPDTGVTVVRICAVEPGKASTTCK